MQNQKTVVVLRKDVSIHTAANAIGHCALRLGWERPEGLVLTDPLRTEDDVEIRNVSAWPFIVLATRASKLAGVIASSEHMPHRVVFVEEMLTTETDPELVTAIAAQRWEEVTVLAVALHGPVEAVDEVTGGLFVWSPG